MKLRLNPIEIPLKDLPTDGREFTYTRDSGELNAALKDLIADNDYKVTFRVSPMGNAYDLKGELETSMNLDCSLCAMELKHPLKVKMHEMMIVQKPLAKGDQQTKANHAHEWVEGGPDYILLDSEVFRVGEYIHEVIGLAEPIRPLGKPDCDTECENMTDAVKKWILGKGANTQSIAANPFQVLEKIKLKS